MGPAGISREKVTSFNLGAESPGGNKAAKSLAFPWISKSLFSLKTAMQEADRALRLENYAARDLANLRAGRAAYRFRECLACVCA